MIKILQILILLSILSCSETDTLEGTWYAAYSIMDGKPCKVFETTLFDFKDNQVYSITIRDLASAELDKVTIDTSSYSISDSTINIFNDKLTYFQKGDSLVLHQNDPDQKLIFRKLSEELKNHNLNPDCFHGPYLIKGENYHDTVDFINDSILIYTGKYDLNFPASKWQIVKYKGFNFFNEHDDLQPVTLIKSCEDSVIKLLHYSVKSHEIELIPQKALSNKSKLIGTWSEIDYSRSNIPSSPPQHQNDLPLKVHFTDDSATIRKQGQMYTLRWNLTSDGKRIYFIDKILSNEGSWKILNTSDSSMTLQLGAYLGKPTVVKLVKIKADY